MQKGLLPLLTALALPVTVSGQEMKIQLRSATLSGVRNGESYEVRLARFEAQANPKKTGNQIKTLSGDGLTVETRLNGEAVKIEALRIEGNTVAIKLPQGLRVSMPDYSVACDTGVWKAPELLCPAGASAEGAQWKFAAKTLKANADTQDLFFGGGVTGSWKKF